MPLPRHPAVVRAARLGKVSQRPREINAHRGVGPRARVVVLLSVVGCLFGFLAPAAALGGCYFLNGSCAYGTMSPSSPSAWTGTYTSDSSTMLVGSGGLATLTLQIRPYVGASGYSFTSGAATGGYFVAYTRSNWQHRCYFTGSGSRSIQCSFSN